jgi:NADH-quinone oxidoreductase subunit M
VLNDSILTIATLLPAAGAVVVALLPRRGQLIQWFSLLVSLLFFLVTLHLPMHYVYGRSGFQFEVNRAWIASPNIRYHLGVDGISLWLVVLTGFLAPVGVLASWRAINHHTKEFYFYFLLQQTAMVGVFVSLDLFLYYAFWELSLVPMAILIAMFGRERGVAAAIKFFLYTFLPSALLLVGILWIYSRAHTFDFVALKGMMGPGSALLSQEALLWISLAFLVAFAVKVPVFPLHGWLGDVFSEAPTAMAMVVAGKLGLYSIFRFNLGLFPAQARQVAPWMIGLAVAGILYGALLALVERDMKRLAAYATLSGVSFCVLGIFCFSLTGLDGALYQTINEGIIGAALLILLGFLYERFGTNEIGAYGGLAASMPRLATFFVITALALAGLPLLNGFVGEFLVLSGSFPGHTGWVAAATSGVILSAAFMLQLTQRIFYQDESALVRAKSPSDLNLREHLTLWPIALLMLAMGVASPKWMRAIDGAMGEFSRPPAATLLRPPAALPTAAEHARLNGNDAGAAERR